MNQNQMNKFMELAAPLRSTQIFAIDTQNPVTIKGKYSAVIGSSQSRIGVWHGAIALGTPLAEVPATETEGNFSLTKQGYDFQKDTYTVGYVVDLGSGTRSICATALLVDGQVLRQQMTSVYLLNQRNANGKSYLTINYSTPNGNTPQSNLDWVDLFPGNTPQPPKGPYSSHIPVPTDQNSGTFTWELDALTYGKQYIIEYNPGTTVGAVSATYTFTWTVA